MELRSRTYTVEAEPIAWQRPRLSKARHFFDNQTQQKLVFGISLNQQHNQEALFEGPIALDITFAFKKSLRKQTRIPVGDIDNLIKFVLDAIKDVLITDDRIVCKISAQKIYSGTPSTTFTITEVL